MLEDGQELVEEIVQKRAAGEAQQARQQATPARLGSKLKAPTTFSPKSTREEHDKFLQFVQDSGRNRKSSPTVIERMAKEPEPST